MCVTLNAVVGVRACAAVTVADTWSGVVPGSTVITSPVLVTLALSCAVPVGVVVADVTFSWVAACASVTDGVTWALVCVVCVVDVDVAVVTFPVLVTAAYTVLVLMHMISTWVHVIVIIGIIG